MNDDALNRIANALERISPASSPLPDFSSAEAFIWQVKPDRLDAITEISRVSLDLLIGIDSARDRLISNTAQFAQGFPANNALLWGARGMGKSSLVKAVHATIGQGLKLIEIQREDLASVGVLLGLLRKSSERFLLFCDDLSFDGDDTAYKSLKAILDGGVCGRPENVLFYATSNRRHLMPRDMIENERSTAINPSESVEEKVSLSDRFGLWLGFYACDQDQYLAMIRGYCTTYNVDISEDDLRIEAIEWHVTRGSRSGRVAWQYFVNLAGRQGVRL